MKVHFFGLIRPGSPCRCGKPLMEGETGCETCMTCNEMLLFLLRNKQWDRCFELQAKASRPLRVTMPSGDVLPLKLLADEGRKLHG